MNSVNTNTQPKISDVYITNKCTQLVITIDNTSFKINNNFVIEQMGINYNIISLENIINNNINNKSITIQKLSEENYILQFSVYDTYYDEVKQIDFVLKN
jgi:hypothetical protein